VWNFLSNKGNMCERIDWRQWGGGCAVCSKLINFSQNETIHEQAINKPGKSAGALSVYQCHENLTLAIRSAQAIGCNVVNIGPDDLYEGREHLVLGLMWQVIRVSTQDEVDTTHPTVYIVRSSNVCEYNGIVV